MAVDTLTPAASRSTRSRALDVLRGLAIACMAVDHVSLFAGWQLPRDTIGRVAMPLFFLLSGHLVRRLSWRLAGVFAVGVLLPAVAPWIDSPNVLLWYVLGAVLLRCHVRLLVPYWLGLAACLTVYANPALFHPYANLGTGYPPQALFGLMFLGAMLEREQLERLTARVPARLGRLLELVGRYPLSFYAGHVLALTVLWP